MRIKSDNAFFFKTTFLILISIAILIQVIQYFFFNYSYRSLKTMEIYFRLLSPFLLLILSAILAVVMNTVIQLNKDFKSKTIWKNLVVFYSFVSLLFFLIPTILIFNYGQDKVSFSNHIVKHFNTNYIVISLLITVLTAGLYSLLKKKSAILITLFLVLAAFFSCYFLYVELNFYVDQQEENRVLETQEYDEIQMVREVGEISYEEEQEIRYQDSINALEYVLYPQNIEDIDCGAYFADIWENPIKDKDSTQFALLNFFNDYLNLRKKNGIGDYVDNISHFDSYEKLTSQSIKIMDKIDRNASKLLSSFTSYDKLIYLIITKDVYEESGLKNLTSLLLKTHKELYLDKTKLDKIYYIMTLPHSNEFRGRSDYFNDLRYYISNDIIAALQSNENFNKPNENVNIQTIDAYTKGEAVWLYSFWARRYKENNDEVVFEILNKIKNHYN